MRRIAVVALFLLSALARATDLPIDVIPRPQKVESRVGQFTMTENVVILTDLKDAGQRAVAELLAAHIRPLQRSADLAQIPAGVTTLPGNGFIVATGAYPHLGDEGYELTVGFMTSLHAATPKGLFRGIQTLRQILQLDDKASWLDSNGRPKQRSFDGLFIKDSPRFPHRGMLLDCGRHFMTKDFVKRYIDLLAYHKMNVLHWHLTEDQGWRIEIRKYPKLTETGAWRTATRDSEQPRDAQGRYGGFYSQADIREVVEYAAERFITVIPEIELPGHSLAALAAYPELSCTGGPFKVRTEWGVESDVYCPGNDATFAFLESILTEVIDLFPSQYVHIGGDECPKERWKTCAKCQARIKSEGLKDEHELQSYFIRRIEKFLNTQGRRIIGWDEILEGGLAPNATVQSWRGMDGAIAAATAGHDVIASPTSHCYLDYPQGPNSNLPDWMGYIDLPKIYSFNPMPEKLSPEKHRHILGVEGNIWTEQAPQTLVDRQVFPRLCALAEVGWSPAEGRDLSDFKLRMRAHYKRLDALGVTYYVPVPKISGKWSFTGSTPLNITVPIDGATIRYTTDGGEPSAASAVFEKPITLSETTTIRARTILGDGRVGDEARSTLSRVADDAPTTVRPEPRNDEWWSDRQRELCKRGRRKGVKVMLIGDSITHGWEGEGRTAWEKYFAPLGAINLGIGGDRTQHVLWRLRNGNIDGFLASPGDAPRAAMLMIGTNNSNGSDNTAEEIAAGIEAIVTEIRTKLPKTKVLLLAIFPRGEKPNAQREKNAAASKLAAALADGKTIFYLDIGQKFLKDDGTLAREIMPDLLHLSPAGYEIWADAVIEKLRELTAE